MNTRLKAVANWLDADQRDAVARFGVDPAYGLNLDARLTATDTLGDATDNPWSWEVAGQLTTLQGDVLENGGLFSGQSSGEALGLPDDSRRALDLATRLTSGSRHEVGLRLDRAQLLWQRDQWRARVGRQAISLGSGLVFNPMDLFNPFAPTATDRDFKPGQDALVVTHLGDTGAELEALVVARRTAGEKHPALDQGSYGLRYRANWRAFEYEVLAARHFDANVAMLGFSGPIGGAVWRFNWVGSRESHRVTHSLVANMDYAFGFRDQAGYAFLEYYHNGYGRRGSAENLTRVNPEALERLGRGELFVLERNYLALGTTLGLNPLLNLTGVALLNLNAGRPLLQSALSYTAGNNATLELGAILPLGKAGEEFGGVVTHPDASPEDTVLTATSRQFYLRAVWFL